jgi:hypothetical protein
MRKPISTSDEILETKESGSPQKRNVTCPTCHRAARLVQTGNPPKDRLGRPVSGKAGVEYKLDYVKIDPECTHTWNDIELEKHFMTHLVEPDAALPRPEAGAN